MKLKIKTYSGDEVDLDVEGTETVGAVKTMIESAKPWLGPVDCMQLKLKGNVLEDDAATLNDAGFTGEVMEVASIPKSAGKDPNKAADRPGEVPTSGFPCVNIVVSGCSNAKTNGTYTPAKPYLKKAAWFKAAEVPDEPMPPAGEASEEGKDGYPAGETKVVSKDNGERFIFYSEKMQKWFAGDALDEGGFTYVSSPGKVEMPPLQGWLQADGPNVVLGLQADVPEGALNVPSACTELEKLGKIDPWENQEMCYVTMLKVLGNIVANPTEGKFFSLKIENAAIQKKILSHDGARGFLEALGFRENAGALTLPLDHHGDAKLGQDVLQGFANEKAYNKIRKDRHVAAAEEKAKADAAKKYERKPTCERNSYGGGGGGGGGGGPQRS